MLRARGHDAGGACRSSSGRSTRTSIILVLATPVLGLSLALVGARPRRCTWASSIPRVGGDPVLFQHLFWFYSHPAVYIMILPAMGVISEMVPTFAHQPPVVVRGDRDLDAGHRVRRLPDLGPPHVRRRHLASSTPASSACCRCSWRSSRRSRCSPGSPRSTADRSSCSTPLLYFFAFLFLFVFGGMTGVAVATQSLDVHWHDTYFVVAHFHFIMVGGSVTGVPRPPRTTGSRRCSAASTPSAFGLLAATAVFSASC